MVPLRQTEMLNYYHAAAPRGGEGGGGGERAGTLNPKPPNRVLDFSVLGHGAKALTQFGA